jgi:hypothetical protein
MKCHPAGAGCDDDPRRGWDRRRGDEAEGPVVVPFSCRRLNSPFGSLRRPIFDVRASESRECETSGHNKRFARSRANLRQLGQICPRRRDRGAGAKAARERSERAVVEVGKRRAERGVGAAERAVGEREPRRRVRVDGMRPEATGRRPRTWGGAGRWCR